MPFAKLYFNLKTFMWTFILLPLLIPIPTGAVKPSPMVVKETSERTVAIDVKTQRAVDEWAEEEKELLRKIDQNDRVLQRVAWDRDKTAEYLATLEKKTLELKEKALEMEKIRANLLPLLDEALLKLTAFVKDDIPYHKADRLKQLENVAQTLNDYDMGLLSKTQSLFDAVSRETDFGYSVNTAETEIEIDGRPVRVTLLKVGRTGLFALTMDSETAYGWDARKGVYVAMDRFAGAIEEGIEIVQKIRIIELTRLPLGRPEKAGDSGDRRDD